MIIKDLDIFSTERGPAKDDSKAIVDSNTVLSFAIALECLQSVRGWNAQVTEMRDRVELFQLAPGNTPNLLWASLPRSSRVSVVEHIFGSAILEGPDHMMLDRVQSVTPSYTASRYSAMRYTQTVGAAAGK